VNKQDLRYVVKKGLLKLRSTYRYSKKVKIINSVETNLLVTSADKTHTIFTTRSRRIPKMDRGVISIYML
jgi:hypothetical protein